MHKWLPLSSLNAKKRLPLSDLDEWLTGDLKHGIEIDFLVGSPVAVPLLRVRAMGVRL